MLLKRLQIYIGKPLDTADDVLLCTRVVLDLMSGLEGSGLNLYTDNYYTSPLFVQPGHLCMWYGSYQQTWFSQGPGNESN